MTWTIFYSIAENFSHGNDDLSRYVMELDQKIRILSKIQKEIIDLYPNVEDKTRIKLSAIVNSIKGSMSNKKYWDKIYTIICFHLIDTLRMIKMSF